MIKKEEGIHEEIEQSKVSENSPHKISLFHNFQKHLVTLLKGKIRLAERQMLRRAEGKLASDLWDYFSRTTRVTKRFLKCLLGHVETDLEHTRSKYYQDYRNLLEHFSDYNQEDIAVAQRYLCREIVRQGRKLLEENMIEEARMQKRE